ncbi:hypothetical protein EV200_101664 [Pedobacter psychrotolerans]|uniref:Uncharacterized protein n=1 Tax=Pedobacter psychrotolerans TaxID=1843235 RepID=A0A4V2S0D0_9SPHI|nr:hypothetical protein [Pedobacter psychrotolerans]TCO31216.1 hypothetical protein EV200_101664 [Pedobacter psychrotolerans]GGE41332.1 hypothetical protein GCM10011413_04020 [Pedobacter psychrotolerans]
MNLKKMSLGLVALVGFGLLITMNAFTSISKQNFTYWQYESGRISDIREGASYSPIAAPSVAPCENGTDLPCVLKVDASIDTQDKLNTYLHDTATFPTASDITNTAMYKKEAE